MESIYVPMIAKFLNVWSAGCAKMALVQFLKSQRNYVYAKMYSVDSGTVKMFLNDKFDY